MRALVAVMLALALAGCEGPRLLNPELAERVDPPPAIVLTYYAEAVACTGLPGYVEAVEWYRQEVLEMSDGRVVDGVHRPRHKIHLRAHVWDMLEDPVHDDARRWARGVVVHESLHDITRIRDHGELRAAYPGCDPRE